ncbi:hypothetical protein EMIT074MI3_30082 [Bacillus licheniformis]
MLAAHIAKSRRRKFNVRQLYISKLVNVHVGFPRIIFRGDRTSLHFFCHDISNSFMIGHTNIAQLFILDLILEACKSWMIEKRPFIGYDKGTKGGESWVTQYMTKNSKSII